MVSINQVLIATWGADGDEYLEVITCEDIRGLLLSQEAGSSGEMTMNQGSPSATLSEFLLFNRYQSK